MNLIEFKNLPDTSTPLNAENLNGIIDLIHPIGSIYLTVDDINPSNLFGGTWEHWGNGRVPVGVDTSQTEFNTVEQEGGSKYLQKHNHSVYSGSYPLNNNKSANTGYENPERTVTFNVNDTTSAPNVYTNEIGSGNSGNLQPYITCYMWKRVA